MSAQQEYEAALRNAQQHQNSGGYWEGTQYHPTWTTGNISLGNCSNGLGQFNKGFDAKQLQQFMQAQEKAKMCFTGNKIVVLCGGEAKEAKDMDEAQAIAESLAHQKSADAYILKPVRKVAPKRDVVTTDLA